MYIFLYTEGNFSCNR